MIRAIRFSAPLAALAVMGLSALGLFPLIVLEESWPDALRSYLERRGSEDSGAINLVSAIYLGYRAYDTLGETIVLLLAVSGSIGMLAVEGSGPSRERERPSSSTRRAASYSKGRKTDLLEGVTGKLGPIVLLFGIYVMMFGHVSPGGGFQGGVVVASGIVFLSLGSGSLSGNRFTKVANLAKLESAGFAALVLGVGLGLATGDGFFASPLPAASPVVYIVALNAIIGLKVGAGIGLLCVAMLGDAEGA